MAPPPAGTSSSPSSAAAASASSLSEDTGLIYGLEFECRSLASVAADTDRVKFLLGTQGIKAENQVMQKNTETVGCLTFDPSTTKDIKFLYYSNVLYFIYNILISIFFFFSGSLG